MCEKTKELIVENYDCEGNECLALEDEYVQTDEECCENCLKTETDECDKHFLIKLVFNFLLFIACALVLTSIVIWVISPFGVDWAKRFMTFFGG